MMLPMRRRPVCRRPPDRDDGGFAMVTAVIVSALIVSITGALALSLTSGGRESARQRELYEARAAGVSALEYLYAQLGNNPFFFNEMLSRNFPTTHAWIALSTATGPDPGTNGHWRQFNRDLTTRECPARRDTCWTMRVKSDGSRDPRAVAVETIVRFDCRGSGYCSVRRFQQQMRRTAELGHAWQRSDLTEVTSAAALPLSPSPRQPQPPRLSRRPCRARYRTSGSRPTSPPRSLSAGRRQPTAAQWTLT